MYWKGNFIVLDVETGGLYPNKSPIMELAYIVLDADLNEVLRRDTFIKPYGNLNFYDERALAIHGISIEQTSKGQSSKEVVKMMCEDFKKLKISRQAPWLVGHNLASFDFEFINTLFESEKTDIFSFVDPFLIDTLALMRIKLGNKGEIKDFKLPTCCEFFNVSVSDSHRALNDVEANVGLFKVLINSFVSGNGGGLVSAPIKKFRHTFQF